MNLETIIANATPTELAAINAAAKRANEKAAVVVTVESGSKRRRYVVAQEDEGLFAAVPTGVVPEPDPSSRQNIVLAREDYLGRFYFGAQWLRSLGKVDEMYRTLGTYEVVKVERIARDKVWGKR